MKMSSIVKNVHNEETNKYNFIPARVIFVLLGFLGHFLLYAFKVVINMSIVAMVKNDHHHRNATINSILINDNYTNIDECPGQKEILEMDGEFDWSEDVKNWILASFFYGYVITQIPAGILANKYGGKWIYGLSILIASIGSLLCPLAARQNYICLIIIRFIQGLSEGVLFPCINTLIAQWMPKMERTRGTTIIFTGSMFGTVFTLPMAAQFNQSHFGWSGSFYTLGIMGIIWFILYSLLVYEDPETHPFITKNECNYIINNGGGKQTKKNVKIPYGKIFTSIPVYGLIFTNFGQNWAFLTILTYMPTYMSNVLHTNNQQNTLISGLPYLGQAFFGWLCSYVTDRIRSSGHISITKLRKINSFIAYIPSAICILLIPMVGCEQNISCLLFILAITLNGANFSGFNSTHVDMAPDFSGTLMGITNSIGNFPGFIVPKVVQAFTANQNTVKSWSYVFYSSVLVNIITTIVYIMACTAKEQSWGRIKNNDNNNNQ